MEIIVKKWEHYNRTLGKHIKSKTEYHDEMKKQGMVSWDEGCRQTDSHKAKMNEPYKITGETERFLKEMNHNKDRKGNVQLGDRAIEFMKSKGVNSGQAPKNLSKKEGGFF